MGTSSVLGRAARCAAAAIAVGAAAFLPATSRAFDVGDDFNDNRVNRAIWGKDTVVRNGLLRETNRRLEYVVTTPTKMDFRGRHLTWGAGPYVGEWEAGIDVANTLAPARFGHEGAMGLSITKCGNRADEVTVEAHAARTAGGLVTGFVAQQWTDGGYSGGGALWFVPAVGSLRVSFDADAKTLTAACDLGGGLRRLATFGVVPGAGLEGSGDWGMSDADSFCIEVYGRSASWVLSGGPAVPGGKIYADNFSAEGLLPSSVLLLQPNGGEVIPAGIDAYQIAWYQPSDVASVRLQYSLDRGVTWKAIDPGFLPGGPYAWQVPTPPANKTACLVRVIAFDAQSGQIGSDRSDRPFTIEVVRLTAPNAGAPPLVSGTQTTITWSTRGTTAPVESVRLAYTLDGGRSWRAIDTSGDPADDGSFDWRVPDVRLAKNRCKVKITLKDGTNRSVGCDLSDGFFTVAPAP